MLNSLRFIVIFDLKVVLHGVHKLDGQSFWRVKDQAQIVGKVSIARLNSQFLLLSDRVRKFVFGDAHEICIEQISPILLQRAAQGLPGSKVVTNHGCFGLLLERSRRYQTASLYMYSGLL
jgi:hypothetical protein